VAQGPQQADDYLASLNPAQRQAATYGRKVDGGDFDAGPLLIIAGAGTGKTMTLAHRVAHLILQGIAPQHILLLTFTRRAAEEMTRRAETIVRRAAKHAKTPLGAGLPWSGTFHSIANRLLRHFAANARLDPAFSVLDRGDAADVMDVARHDLGYSRLSRRFPKKDTCLAIYSRTVNAHTSLDTTLAEAFPWCVEWEPELRQLFRQYVLRKQQSRALDYDDLLLYWKHLTSDAEIAAEIGSWFRHVLVDEYQDTNQLQAEILAALKPGGAGVTVVGDDAQSIYSFRAADVGNILGFPDRYAPAATVMALERSYRSSQPILDCANRLIAESETQYRKSLYTRRAGGGMPQYVTVEDGDAEAEYVVETVLANREAGLQLKDQAVLFRGSHVSDRLELDLVRHNIPYKKYGGLKFLEAAHVKDLLSVLKWADNPRNRVAAFRVLQLLPGMGPSRAARAFEHVALADHRLSALHSLKLSGAAAAAWPGFCELMQALAAVDAGDDAWQGQLGQARRWYRSHLERLYDSCETREADLEQLEQIAGRYRTRERFLTELTLDPPAAAGDLAGDPLLDEDYLVLSTVHSAKGREWDSVFVLSVVDGHFPSEFATGRPALIEEERRLLYVAMTRAKQSLHLLAPLRYYVTQQPRDGDRHVYGARSRFITDGLLQTMERRFHGRRDGDAHTLSPSSDRQVDVAARMRALW
jgi:DNA helicase-2/ATP-dependent DNA helicase PcrA